ncbi:MAG: DUF3857 domain-containing protein [Sandaracinaceae bacterium]
MRGSFARVGLLAAATWLLAGPAAAEPEVRVRTPIPGWVVAVEPPPPAATASESIELLLADTQLRIDADTTRRHHHRAYRLRDAQAVQEGSTIRVDVADDETLDLHYVRLVRDGASIDALGNRDRVRLLHREERLEEGIVDDRRSAVLLLEGVRVGDVLEYAFTIHTPLDARGGRHSSIDRVHEGPAIGHLRWSARWSEDAPVRTRLVQIPDAWVVATGPTELILEARDVPVAHTGGNTPGWYVGLPTVELSQYDSWSEVARWAAGTYGRVIGGPVPPEVPMDEIRAGASTEDRVLRALRYVQDDVRYLGIESGEGALVPRPPAVVARRRYGDCKDKAVLLTTLLRVLGVEADVALANALRGTVPDGSLPSLAVFDHVVVRAVVDGRTRWLDPTRTGARGTLDTLAPIGLRRVLVARADVEALEDLPAATLALADHEVTERWDLNRTYARLELEVVSRGAYADILRPVYAARAPNHTPLLESLGYRAERQGEAEVEDDPIANELRVRERFHVPDFWRGGTRDVSPWSILDRIPAAPDAARPAAPFALIFPLHAHHHLRFDSAREWATEPVRETRSAGALRLDHRVEVDGRILDVDFVLTSTDDHVAADDVEAFREALEPLRTGATYQVIEFADSEARSATTPSEPTPPWLVWLCCSAPVGLILLVVGWRFGRQRWATRRRRAFLRSQRVVDGETPERPLDVKDRAAAEKALGTPRCCDRPVDTVEWSSARLGGERVTIGAWTCPVCGERRRRFFRVADEG